mmetsp:Transcript_5405/g.13143  ORF Transcript_5405/g.13143 Transcript_5405/m.13143 type:complete len:86 (+) Transcript_5405:94-351(+)
MFCSKLSSSSSFCKLTILYAVASLFLALSCCFFSIHLYIPSHLLSYFYFYFYIEHFNKKVCAPPPAFVRSWCDTNKQKSDAATDP